MWIAQSIDEVRAHRSKAQPPVALVPTMGALHAGHLSLIDVARRHGKTVIVSVFVNPTQFGTDEDLNSYPRPVRQDLVECEAVGVDGVFHPTPMDIYPPEVPACRVEVPAIADDLEGRCRPGHFAGVCRIVAKLFNIMQPDIACFGQKDFQQLRVIQAMVADLNMPIGIIECPTVRDADGLALSSRNGYLTREQRRHALGLFKALNEAKMMVCSAGETDPSVVEQAMKQVMAAYRIEVDYAVVRHRLTLASLDSIDLALTGGVVALVAGRVGSVHLIDNLPLIEPGTHVGP